MFPYLLPKPVPFFEMLQEQNALLRDSSELLVYMLENTSSMSTAHKDLALLEEKGDQLHIQIIKELSRAFITPIDREDLMRVNQEQEACMDSLQRLGTRLHIFEFPRILFPMLQLSRLSRDMLDLTQFMLDGLAKKQDSHKTKAFHSLRSEADMVMVTGIAELMDTHSNIMGREVVQILKWSQAYERMDMALEQINRLAETLEEAVLKYV